METFTQILPQFKDVKLVTVYQAKQQSHSAFQFAESQAAEPLRLLCRLQFKISERLRVILQSLQDFSELLNAVIRSGDVKSFSSLFICEFNQTPSKVSGDEKKPTSPL